jgi:hypothetical protein
MPSNAVRQWLDIATPTQARQFAKAAKTSVPHLRHIAAGRRSVSAEMGQRLAAASKTLGVRALYLDQRALCPACGVCPIARKL